ncbi:capsid protein [Cellulomonas hominis]|uniref:Capsid protein n=1 Tax=Cellulomonas hominis TaxID=156981 RepID=A0A7Z8K304_9CELL|nr:phage minor capsid protein [Cellulomonas hominis]TKR27142.1 capsid protein [Cellulomonas hominis]
MPTSPDHGARLAAQVTQLVAAAELVILQRIRDRLAAGIDAPTWAVNKLAELQALREAVAGDLGALDDDLAAAVADVIDQAYGLGRSEAAADVPGAAVPAFVPAAVRRLAEDVLTKVIGARPTVLRATADAYREVVARATAPVLLGASTRVQAAQAALDDLLARGITGFRDAAGRRWTLESYVEMATRTGAGRAAVLGHLDGLTEQGHDLVYPIPGPRACASCDEQAGKVLSISGATTSVLVDGRLVEVTSWREATADGHLFGPNCRCSVGAYFPGITTPNVERPDPAGYAAGQEQRRLERGVREWKRREQLALTPEAGRAARAKVRQWQGRLRDHLAAHPDLRRAPRREQIGRAR